jgi:uncharacterized protein YukJ
MPLPHYSVLKGDPVSGQVQYNKAGKNPHYHIKLKAGSKTFEIAINIQSDDGSEVLYTVDHAFVPPDPAGLGALPMGVTPLPSKPGGLALDFVREQVDGTAMVERAAMTLLPTAYPAGNRHNALHNEVVDLLNRAVADPSGVIYAFGDTFADQGAVSGIHDIHMNQGNPKKGGHQGDNGIWQDGATFVNLPATKTWLAVFIAFQSESWNTDSHGNPV